MMEETVQTEEAEAAEKVAEKADKPEKLAVGVQFRPAGKIYTYVTEDESLVKGDRVVVESESGTSVGEVARASHEPGKGQLPANVKKLIRRAGDEDIVEYERCKEKAIECFESAAERIRSRQLPMKLIDVDISEGGKKAILIAGCMGPCGQTTCCSTHLRQFQSISISMAKHQGLAPNPAKLTGMCGKLKCCLAYEQAAYDECRKGLLKTGSPVETSGGAGKIIGHNVLKRECIVRLYGGGEMRTPCEKCRKLTPEERDEAVTQARKAREESEERGSRRGRKDSGKRDQKRKREKRDGKERK
jgi:cell fate regulator YaaT (PSP1 superfamily)